MNLEHLGLGGQGADVDEIHRRLQNLTNQLSTLRTQRSVGNLQYGGPIRTEIGQSVWTQWLIRDVDNDTPFEFDLIVPDNLLRIHRCQVWLTPRPLRKTIASASGATSAVGSSHTHSTPSGTSGAGSSHDHTLSGTSATEAAHLHGVNGNAGSSNPDTPHSHTIGLNTATPDAHSHGIGSYDAAAEATHTHSTPSGTSGSEASHTHAAGAITLVDGVTEGATAAGLNITIDGVDRTTALGGPWSADAGPLDITPYLIDSRFIPVDGRHAIILDSTGDGAIEVTIEWEVTRRPLLT